MDASQNDNQTPNPAPNQENLVGKKRHTPTPELDTYMTGVANRVSATNVGLDPATIISVLQVVLPIVARCYGVDTGASPEQLRASVVEQNEKQPARLRRRLTAQYLRESPGRRLSREQAEAMAEATINETLASDASVITGIYASFGD